MADDLDRVFGASLQRFLDSLGEVTESAVEKPLRQAIDLLEAKAVELAPVKTGNLQSSTVTRFLRSGSRILAELAFTAPYAAEAHELPEDARGPLTQAKPGNEFGPAGPKYVERPLRGLQKQFGGIVGESVLRFWRQNARIR